MSELKNANLKNIRIFLIALILIFIIVLKPPMKSSLEKSMAVVSSAQQHINSFHVEYALVDGRVISENSKNGLLGLSSNRAELLKLQGSNEKIIIWHKNAKVWQIQKQNGESILNYSDIAKKRYLFLLFLSCGLLLIFFFLPKLI